MKTCLIILSLLFAFNFDCKGQDSHADSSKYYDSILRHLDKQLVELKLLQQLKEDLENLTFSKYNYDTLPVIMLICDTNTGATSTMGFFHPLDQAQNDRKIPYWQYGYLVRYAYGVPEFSYGAKPYAEYLDENKKRLPKNIIVWLSQTVK